MVTEDYAFQTLNESKWFLGKSLRVTVTEWSGEEGAVTVNLDCMLNGVSEPFRFFYTGFRPLAHVFSNGAILNVGLVNMSEINVSVTGDLPANNKSIDFGLIIGAILLGYSLLKSGR